MCSIASLAERPQLVKRLFPSGEKSADGKYKVRLCKNGEWIYVDVDDLFPVAGNG
jgi:hypothetical protein